MNIFGIIVLILWLIVGILTLKSNRITKLDYGLTWICLILQIVCNYLVK